MITNNQIEVRAWSKKFKRMVYADDKEYSITIGNGGTSSVWKDLLCDEGVPVMLYIGKKDKNGRKIYAGDIAKMKVDSMENGDPVYFKGQIYFKDYQWHIGEFAFDKSYYFGVPSFREMEVIGNIYERKKNKKS